MFNKWIHIFSKLSHIQTDIPQILQIILEIIKTLTQSQNKFDLFALSSLLNNFNARKKILERKLIRLQSFLHEDVEQWDDLNVFFSLGIYPSPKIIECAKSLSSYSFNKSSPLSFSSRKSLLIKIKFLMFLNFSYYF